MENDGTVHHKISAEDVIWKLKDDGDFDRLRLKIIRKIKDNEDLRSSIISMVKQSAALNHAGSENLRPRQLSDSIHQEVGDKVMSLISDSLWQIIRSQDGMKGEIAETVQSVYNKLLNPKANEEGGSSSLNCSMPDLKQADNVISHSASPHQGDDLSDCEPIEPPGFSLSNHHQNNHVKQPKQEPQLPLLQERRPTAEQRKKHRHAEDVKELDNLNANADPGFSEAGESKHPSDGSDEDPDLPPGFG